MSKKTTLFSKGFLISFTLIGAYFVVLSCASTPRLPSSVSLPEGLAHFVPISQISQNLGQIQATSLSSKNCEDALGQMLRVYTNWAPVRSDYAEIKDKGSQVLSASFQARVHIHNQLPQMSAKCLSLSKDVFRELRAMEDTVAIMAFGDKQISGDNVDFPRQNIPLIEMKNYHPYFLGPAANVQLQNSKKVFGASRLSFNDFKEGDLMITKGISLISGTISSAPYPQSLFSHIVYVAKYYDTYETQKARKAKGEKLPAGFINANGLGTLESYIGTGVNFFTMRDALLNENARILILRPRDQKLAQSAHNYITKRVIDKSNYKVQEEKDFLASKGKTPLSESLESMAAKRVIRYDYAQDFSENESLSCEEVAFDALKIASNGQFLIPQSPSLVDIKDPRMVKNMGLKPGPMMFPSDMEVDPRFEIVLDWTDYRLIRDNWRKDAIMSEVFRWVNEEDYIMNTSGTSALGALAWKAREIKFLWPLLSKITSIPENWEPGVPVEGIKTVGNFKNLGGRVLTEIERLDKDLFKKEGRWMTRAELRYHVNQIRLVDLQSYRERGVSMFHDYFRGKDENFVNPVKGD